MFATAPETELTGVLKIVSIPSLLFSSQMVYIPQKREGRNVEVIGL